MHYLLDRSSPDYVSTPISKGGQCKLTSSGTPIRITDEDCLIGPERKFKMYSKNVRRFATVYSLTCAFAFSLCLFGPLCLLDITHKLIKGIFKLLEDTSYKVNPDTKFRINAKLDYTCGFLHEGTAVALTRALELFFPITYTHARSYGIDDLEIVVSDKATSEEKMAAKNEFELMKSESRQNIWNRFTSLFGIEPRFCFSRGFIMCNHLGNIDGIIGRGLAFPAGSKVMYKKDLQKIPIVGCNFQLAKDIDISFVGDTYKTEEGFKESLDEQIKRLIAHRLPVVLFPEGGRSRYRRMLPFRRGMFNIAIEHDIPIWPLALYGTQDIEIFNGPLILNPSDIKIKRSKKIIFPYGHTADSLMIAVRDEIQLLLSEIIPNYDIEADCPMETLEEFKSLEKIIRNKSTVKVHNIESEMDKSSLSRITTPLLDSSKLDDGNLSSLPTEIPSAGTE